MSTVLPPVALPLMAQGWEDCDGHRRRCDMSGHSWSHLHYHLGATMAMHPQVDAFLQEHPWNFQPQRNLNALCQWLNESQQRTENAAALSREMPTALMLDIMGQPSFRFAVQRPSHLTSPAGYADSSRLIFRMHDLSNDSTVNLLQSINPDIVERGWSSPDGGAADVLRTRECAAYRAVVGTRIMSQAQRSSGGILYLLRNKHAAGLLLSEDAWEPDFKPPLDSVGAFRQ